MTSYHSSVFAPRKEQPIVIIVPVYRGLQDTQRCLESVISAQNRHPWRVLIIDDRSPEPELSAWLERFAAQHVDRVHLLRTPQNLGFVRSVNLGMEQTAGSDVVLLNSDAEVGGDGWLDRLRSACYRDARTGTATPWSNNATIFSYPAFPEGGSLPVGETTASMARLCAEWLDSQTLEVPTAHGFCMYIRRECLDDIGLFDAAAFGRGYGEENDFCLRASQKGWRHVQALDVFVYHRGSVSFGAERDERVQEALAVIRQRYPYYEGRIQSFIADDPARIHRLTLDIARFVSRPKTRILLVSHDGEGGTERHQRELIAAFSGEAAFIRLTPCPGGVQWFLADGTPQGRWYYRMPDENDALREHLRLLDVEHVHYHHWYGLPESILSLADELGLTYDVTLHDHYAYCPQIHLTQEGYQYCGEKGPEQCQRCLQNHPAPDGTQDIGRWRERHARLLARARYVISPTHDVAARVWHYFGLRAHVAGHDQLSPSNVEPRPAPRPIQRGEGGTPPRLRVAIIGALGQIKGADLLESVALLAAQKKAPIEFHLVGYAYRRLQTLPWAALIIHGRYADETLPHLLEWIQPHVIWLPSRVPETYSYTLSAALNGGWPVATVKLGALAERLHGRPWSWLLPPDADARRWLQFFLDLHTRYLLSPAGPQSIVPVAEAPFDTSHSGPALDYRRDYLPPSRIHPQPARAVGLLASSPRTRLRQPRLISLRLRILRALVTLRSTPVFTSLAARIPQNVQRRVKRWLVH